jgi:ABC-2 type transport system ATP-binding protein
MIEVEGLTKYYGEFPAIVDISFRVEKGEILGFLGPNGAGKTTAMRVLTGFMPPSAGVARIAGFDVVSESLEARRRIGYLPETVALYTDMTVKDYLAFMGTIRGMNRKAVRRRIDDVVAVCRLEQYYETAIGKLSKGFRQRVGIAQAILHEPEVLILDEPTVGIDPIQIVETRQLIKDLGGQHTILISTHILPEVSMLCERVIIIHEGQVVAEDRPSNLGERLRATERLEMDIRGPSAKVMSALRGVKGVQEVKQIGEGDRTRYVIFSQRGNDLREELSRQIVEKGLGLRGMQSDSMSLEEIFLRLTTEEGQE